MAALTSPIQEIQARDRPQITSGSIIITTLLSHLATPLPSTDIV